MPFYAGSKTVMNTPMRSPGCQLFTYMEGSLEKERLEQRVSVAPVALINLGRGADEFNEK